MDRHPILTTGCTLALALIFAACSTTANRRDDYNFRNTTLNYNPQQFGPRARWGDKKKPKKRKKLARVTPRKKIDPYNGFKREPKTIKYPDPVIVKKPQPTKYPQPTKKPLITPTPRPQVVKKPSPQPRTTLFRVPRGDVSKQRTALVASAVKRLGQKQSNAAEFIQGVLKENNISVPTSGKGTLIQGMYYGLKKRKQVYDKDLPLVGDLVFFHNTRDQNRDNRNNDWYSLIGVVESIGVDGTVSFIAPHFGTIKRLTLNLRRPQVRRDEKTSKVINAFLRVKRMDDPEYTQYLAGELYAGFGRIFSSRPQLVSQH